MKNNTITLSQAHKMYTGNSMGLYAFKLSIGGILMYCAFLFYFFIFSLISEGNVSDAVQEINNTMLIRSLLTLDAGCILMITGLVQYDKQLPGGKYFRTVNGGFDTYIKMKNASLIARIIILVSLMTFGAILGGLGLIELSSGIIDIVYIGAFLLISIGLINFVNLVKNPAVRGFITPFAIFAAGLPGVIIPEVTEGNICVALAITAIAIPFIIISQKVMLSNYKRKKWN